MKNTEPSEMGELEDFVGCIIKCDLTNINLNIYQPHLITNITQGFNEYIELIMAFNYPATPHKGIVYNK